MIYSNCGLTTIEGKNSELLADLMVTVLSMLQSEIDEEDIKNAVESAIQHKHVKPDASVDLKKKGGGDKWDSLKL